MSYIKENVDELVLCKLLCIPIILLALPAVPNVSIKGISFSLLDQEQLLSLEATASIHIPADTTIVPWTMTSKQTMTGCQRWQRFFQYVLLHASE